MLILSALISVEQLVGLEDGHMELVSPAWGHLHFFFELITVGTGVCGQYATYWYMGFAIRCVADKMEFGFIHPVFENAPPQCKWSELYLDYWGSRMLKRRSHRDVLGEFHDRLRDSLGEEADVDCGGCCGMLA